MAQGDLITLDEYATSKGKLITELSPAEQAQISQTITFASQAIRDYVDRDLASASVIEQRTYEYDGSGFLDIDDASAVTAVAFSAFGLDYTLDPNYEWRAGPWGKPIITYLALPQRISTISPEMGFTQNLDVIYREGRYFSLPAFVKVTGTFGWVTVPGPVQQAAIFTVDNFLAEDPELSSESIESYSYSRPPSQDEDVIPKRAKALLDPYAREVF